MSDVGFHCIAPITASLMGVARIDCDTDYDELIADCITEKRIPGTLKGKIRMAPDFDDTPDCFKEYMP